MNIKQIILQGAILAAQEEFNAENVLNLIKVSQQMLRPDSGLVWTEVDEVIHRTFWKEEDNVKNN